MATYGDGLASVDISALFRFHRSHGKLATITAVPAPARFGALELDKSRVSRFSEKPRHAENWINGGFFVFEPSVLDYIEGDEVSLEGRPLELLAQHGQLMAFQHTGFWQPMDTQRDRIMLENLWMSEQPPWKIWH